MKKLLVFLLMMITGLTLYGCTEITYESVHDSYETYIASYDGDYQELMDIYNVVNTQWVKATILINSYIETLNFSSKGSGFIYAEDDIYYYALTNSHVVGGNMTYNHYIEVTDMSGKDYYGTLIAYDTDYDLAVIRFLKGNNNLAYFEFAHVNPELSTRVIIMGHPFGQLNGITLGYYVDFTTTSLSDQSIGTIDFQVLKLDAPVEPGSSGSVVINELFQTIGVVFAGSYNDESNFSDFSYAIPVEQVLTFMDQHSLEVGDIS